MQSDQNSYEFSYSYLEFRRKSAVCGDEALDRCKNSAKMGFDSTSSFFTCLAIITRLSPQPGHGSTN